MQGFGEELTVYGILGGGWEVKNELHTQEEGLFDNGTIGNINELNDARN